MTRHLTVWDGIKFYQLPADEAKKLESANKVQVCDRVIAAHEFKHKNQFASNTPAPAPAPKADSGEGAKKRASRSGS